MYQFLKWNEMVAVWTATLSCKNQPAFVFISPRLVRIFFLNLRNKNSSCVLLRALLQPKNLMSVMVSQSQNFHTITCFLDLKNFAFLGRGSSGRWSFSRTKQKHFTHFLYLNMREMYHRKRHLNVVIWVFLCTSHIVRLGI